MFKQFYGMSFNPFDKGLKEKDAYVSNDLKEMISRLEYLDKTRGLGVFTAFSGSGKTFALRCFAKKLNANLTKIIYLSFSTITTMEFYRQLSIALGLEPFAKKSDMFKNIQDYMENMLNDKRIHYIIVLDELCGAPHNSSYVGYIFMRSAMKTLAIIEDWTFLHSA